VSPRIWGGALTSREQNDLTGGRIFYRKAVSHNLRHGCQVSNRCNKRQQQPFLRIKTVELWVFYGGSRLLTEQNVEKYGRCHESPAGFMFGLWGRSSSALASATARSLPTAISSTQQGHASRQISRILKSIYNFLLHDHKIHILDH
jgi:hypothetical protein